MDDRIIFSKRDMEIYESLVRGFETVTLVEIERMHIVSVLESVGHNQREAAKHLGISRSTLWRKLCEIRDAHRECLTCSCAGDKL